MTARPTATKTAVPNRPSRQSVRQRLAGTLAARHLDDDNGNAEFRAACSKSKLARPSGSGAMKSLYTTG